MESLQEGMTETGICVKQESDTENEPLVKRVKTEESTEIPGLDEATSSFSEAVSKLSSCFTSEGVASGLAKTMQDVLKQHLSMHDRLNGCLRCEATKKEARQGWLERDALFDSYTRQVRDLTEGLAETLDQLLPDRELLKKKTEFENEDFIRQTVAYSHKISYTTYAPASDNHACHRPPAPQDWQFMRGRLHKHAKEAAARAAAAAAAEQAAGRGGKAPAHDLPPGVPRMPEGWKPGDPIPGLEGGAEELRPVPGSSLPPSGVRSAVTAAPGNSGSAVDLGLLLDPNDISDEGEYTSESESEDEDD
mmetsp:Transcript_26414/g.62741  ORF Transcript_26414/g.62741 Transcript_26414/m.62741 type:complete len:306 (+) Transcript_26414:135-1052(+)